jgi:hypothetical protein
MNSVLRTKKIYSHTPGKYIYTPNALGGSFERVPDTKGKKRKYEEEKQVDLLCYEDFEEIFEDIDMEKHLNEISVLSKISTINLDISDHQIERFQLWGMNNSPYVYSISRLY